MQEHALEVKGRRLKVSMATPEPDMRMFTEKYQADDVDEKAED